MEQSSVIELIRAVRGLAEGTVLAWEDSTRAAAGGVLFGHVDVHQPLLQSRLGWNWIWTVVPVEHHPNRSGDATTLVVPAELVVVRGRHGLAIYDLPWPDDGEADESEPHNGPAQLAVAEGWTTTTISVALSRWCVEWAGRDDVRFAYRDTASMHPSLEGVHLQHPGG